MQTVIFIGPQGSGKGTQVDLLVQAWGAVGRLVTPIQTGDVFRALSMSENYAAQAVHECLQAGRLMPDAITNGLVVGRVLQEVTAENDIVFDGYPRNRAQLSVLLEVLTFLGRTAIDVVHLATPDIIVQARMEERGRNDDTAESIKVRLATYHQETKPLLEEFQVLPNVRVHSIDGSETIETVHESVVTALGTQ